MRGELPRRLQPKNISRLGGFVFCFLVWLPSPLWAHTAVQNGASAEWHWRPDAVFALIVFAFTYARGWVRLRNQSGHAATKSQLALYLAGLASIGVALLSPIDALASTLLSMHMVQHLLLLMIAPLSVLLANPLAAFLWGLPTALRHGIGKILARESLFRRLLWAATLMPVTWSLYVVNLWAWHHPALYQAALRNERVHDLQHLLFFSTAILFWWPIVDPGPRLHGSISYGFRIIYLVAATLQNTLLGFVISFPERVLYPFYATVPELRSLAPIDDQALGGGIMWVSGHMYLIPILVLVARFMQREEAAVSAFDPKGMLKRSPR
jgi:cytochrome c oxidase assembly factor CtaG